MKALWRQFAVWWQGLAVREQQGLAAAGAALGLLLLWTTALAPALRTMREAPAERQALQLQILQMQKLAAESKELRGLPPIAAQQAAQALTASSQRLGDKAKLTHQGDRWILTFSRMQPEELRAWLAEARSGARARPVDAQVARGADGLAGTITVAAGSPQ